MLFGGTMSREDLGWIMLFAALITACRRDPDDLREWRVEDHDHTNAPNAAQVADPPPDAAIDPMGISDVTIAAWKQRCVTCHGTVGRGDGPQGAMVRASDLTRPAWQASVTDAQIAQVIRTGRGSMPAFDLPEATVTGLVRLIRLLDASRIEAPAGPADAAPAASSTADAGTPAKAVRAPKDKGQASQ
jgi:mono/diheme cytochrome c family protein